MLRLSSARSCDGAVGAVQTGGWVINDLDMEVSINEDSPIAGWFIRKNPHLIGMIKFGGTLF